MKRIFILLFVLGFFIPLNLLAQPYQDRHLIVKNRVLEMREFTLVNNNKNLSSIYYFNDSGLVETSIYVNVADTMIRDSITIPHFLYDSRLYDTSSIITYIYDSQNRLIEEIDIYYYTSNKKRAEHKIECKIR